MNWQRFIQHLKGQGYEGDGEDFEEVQKWLKEKGYNSTHVGNKEEGTKKELKALYADRPGKMLDVSAVEAEAAFDKRIDDALAAKVAAIEKDVGPLKKSGEGTKAHKHGVAITAVEMIEKDPNVGYGKFHELGWGEFMLDVYKAAVALKNGTINQIPERLTKSQAVMLTKQAGMNEAVDSEGGFLAPTEHRRELLRKVYETGIVFPRARVVPMLSQAIKVPYIVESSRVDGSRHGGVQGYWAAEAQTVTASNPAGGRLTLTAHKLFALGYATDELEDDSNDMASISALQLLSELFAEELAFKLDDAFIRGTGVGQPLGILNSAPLVTLTRNTATEVRGVDVMAMWIRLWARSRLNAVWFVNQDVEGQLAQLNFPASESSGAARHAAFIMVPPGGWSGSQFSTIMGRPVIPIEQCPTLGTDGDIILADMSQYLHGMRRGLRTAQSIHVNFTTDETAFKATLRSDGQPWWQSALTPFQGTNTQSPFIVIN